MLNPIIDYVREEIGQGRRVGVFSCEDPLNAPFHRDLLQLGDYLHLKTTIAARVELASVDLGVHQKQIDSWLVVGHSDGLAVCGGVHLVMRGYADQPDHLRQMLERVEQEGSFESSLEQNVIEFARLQSARLRQYLGILRPESADTFPVQTGIIRYIGRGYVSELV